MRPFTILFVVFMAVIGLAPAANAQTSGFEVQVAVVGHAGTVTGSLSEHVLTFTAPVGVPGVGLAPGWYIFRFIAPSVIQVLDDTRTTIYAMFMTTPTWRSEVTNDYAVSLRKIRSDAPARLEKLFFPGESVGYDFTFPRIEFAGEAEQVAMK